MRQLTKNKDKKHQQEIVGQKRRLEGSPDFNNDLTSTDNSLQWTKHLFVVDWQVDNENA